MIQRLAVSLAAVCIVSVGAADVAAQRRRTPTPAAAAAPPAPVAAVALPTIDVPWIRLSLTDRFIKDVPSAVSGGRAVGQWTFAANDLKEIDITSVATDGTKRTLMIYIRTANEPGLIDVEQIGDQVTRQFQTILEGKMRLQFEYIDNQWLLLGVENLTAKVAFVDVRVNQPR